MLQSGRRVEGEESGSSIDLDKNQRKEEQETTISSRPIKRSGTDVEEERKEGNWREDSQNPPGYDWEHRSRPYFVSIAIVPVNPSDDNNNNNDRRRKMMVSAFHKSRWSCIDELYRSTEAGLKEKGGR